MTKPVSGLDAEQGLLGRVFKLKQHGTTARTETIAGITTFLTMVYIVFVNPQILGAAGMDTQAVFVTTCLIAAFGSIFMGLLANLPVALAPAMGLNAFFAFVVVGAMGISWQVGMGAIFWGAVGLLLLTIFRIRYWMIANIPVSLRVGITSGIGLFIGMMGLKNAGIVVANPDTLVTIGSLTSHNVLLGALGFFIIAVLSSRNFHAAVLVSIVVTTLIGWMLGDVKYGGLFSLPPSITSVVGQVDVAGALNIGLAGIIFSFMLVNLFDSSGTLIGVTDKAGLTDNQGKRYVSDNPEEMIRKLTGMAIPLNNLRQWMLGLPGEAGDFALDDQYRLSKLTYQQGGQTWKVDYQGYSNAVQPTLPNRLELQQGDQRIKLKMDNWTLK